MSLFQCDNCGCVENTALAAQSYPEVFAELFDWTGIEEKKAMKLCSACGPTTYSDGTPTEYGKWHGQFDQTFLPKGKFKTSRNGNLEHIATGDQNYSKWKVKPFKKVDKLQSQVEQLQKQLKAMTEERDCWIANAKNLQVGYNDLDKRIRQLQSELAAATAGKVTIVKEKFYPADKELIEQLQADNARLREALQSTVSTLQKYASSNPKHYYREVLQDPNGVHAALAIVNEALASTDSSNKTIGNPKVWRSYRKENAGEIEKIEFTPEQLAEQKAQWRREVLEEVGFKKYRDAMDALYNHNAATRHAVIRYFGIHHPRMAEQPESKS